MFKSLNVAYEVNDKLYVRKNFKSGIDSWRPLRMYYQDFEMALNKAFPRFNFANLRDGLESVRLKGVTNSITFSFCSCKREFIVQ